MIREPRDVKLDSSPEFLSSGWEVPDLEQCVDRCLIFYERADLLLIDGRSGIGYRVGTIANPKSPILVSGYLIFLRYIFFGSGAVRGSGIQAFSRSYADRSYSGAVIPVFLFLLYLLAWYLAVRTFRNFRFTKRISETYYFC